MIVNMTIAEYVDVEYDGRNLCTDALLFKFPDFCEERQMSSIYLSFGNFYRIIIHDWHFEGSLPKDTDKNSIATFADVCCWVPC